MKKSFLIFTSIFALVTGISHLSYIQYFNASNRVAAQSSQWDFGDAPAPYPTLLGAGGARHINTQEEWLGAVPPPTGCFNNTTVESDAKIVDLDEDDGLCQWWFDPATGFAYGQVVVSVSSTAPPGPRYINVLTDLNQNGSWEETNEWVIENFSLPLPQGACQFPLTVWMGFLSSPFPVQTFETWVRITVTRDPISAPWQGTGEFPFGETEDYLLAWNPIFPPGEGGPAPGARCPGVFFKLKCKPQGGVIPGGGSRTFLLSSTGNVRPNRIRSFPVSLPPCDFDAAWVPDPGITEVAPGANVLTVVPNPMVSTTAKPNCLPTPDETSKKFTASYLNFDPAVGPVGGAVSADTCVVAVLHPRPRDIPPFFTVRGKVRDENGGKVGGADIQFINSDGVTLLALRSKSSGKYDTGKKLPEGTYTVVCEKDGFISETKSLTVGPRNAKANFTLKQFGQIEGQVALEGSFFDVFALVEITDVSGKQVFNDPTDNRGRYDTERTLAPGIYKVKATSLGYFTGEASVEIRGGDRAEINLNLRIRPPDFYVNCTPSVLRAMSGGSITSRCNAIPLNGFNGFVTSFSAVDLPTGVTASFSPEFSAPPGLLARSTLTLKVGEEVAPGSYPFKVGATSGNQTRFDDMLLMVAPRILDPDFVIACDPASLTILQGQSSQSSCRVTSIDGFAGQVMLACAGLPAGVQCAFDPNPVTPPPNGSAMSALTLSVDAGAQPGTYSFQVTSVNTDVVRSFTLQLTIVGRGQEPSFILACNPSSVTAPPGGIAQTSCTVTSMGGFSRLLSFSVTGLPEEVEAEFQPHSLTPPPDGEANSLLMLRLSPQARPGTYQLLVFAGTVMDSPPVSVRNALTLVVGR